MDHAADDGRVGERAPRCCDLQRVAARNAAAAGSGLRAAVPHGRAGGDRALLGGALLWLLRQKRPARGDLGALVLVSLGVVVGFPLLTALALRGMTSAQAIVFVGMLPLATALFGVMRGGERPRPAFWLFSILGSGAVAGFALAQGGAAGLAPNLLMLAAILLCGLGYAEGAALSRRLGGWQVISWALVLALPAMGALALATWPARWDGVGAAAWSGLAYVSVFSMW